MIATVSVPFPSKCDTARTTVDSDGPFVATKRVDDMVVVVHRGAVLVCPKRRDQDVKQIDEARQIRAILSKSEATAKGTAK